MYAMLRTSVAAVSLLLVSCSLDSWIGLTMPAQLQTGGVSAQATIIDVWDTGMTLNDNPVIGMHVDVQPANGQAFRGTIAKTVISRIDVPQFQPGKVIPVRYDPANPAMIALDRGGSQSNGNPYHDGYASLSLAGSTLEPPQPPVVYRGTANADEDFAALLENGYAPLGVAVVNRGGQNPDDALGQAKDIGAHVVILYGKGFAAQPEMAPLPFHRSTSSSVAAQLGTTVMLPALPAGSGARMATFWGKQRPFIFGMIGRELTPGEQSLLRREDGVVATIVPVGSPAGAAGITTGDVITRFDGKAVRHSSDLDSAYLRSEAGKSVVVDILRGGVPASVTVQLNAAPSRQE